MSNEPEYETTEATPDDTEITIHQFIERNGITMTYRPTPTNPDMIADPKWQHDNWICYFERDQHPNSPAKMTAFFSTGVGWRKKTISGAPIYVKIAAADVLDSLASAARSYEDTRDALDFMVEFGYTDPHDARKTYDGCKRVADQLREFLGAALYDSLLYHVESL